ncbi:unnamed protein product, partial [Prorocentrum cordatum]
EAEERRALEEEGERRLAELQQGAAEPQAERGEDSPARSPYAHLPEEREARRARRTTALRPLLTPLIDYVMLLVGQTGCGKTSLVDLLAGPETKEATPDDAMSSKTSDARAYRLKLGHVGLTVIDTPGFGDTRGRATDETHVKKILACLENVGAINCVVLTINGREARISATLRYALTMLTSVLPKGVLSSNVAVVFTNTENERQLNFSRGELAKFGIPSPASVCLNNPLCELQRALLAPGDVSGDLVRESFVLVERTLETVAALMEQIRNFEPVPTLEFKQIHEKRLEIEGILGDLHARYAEEEKRLSDIGSIKADILSTGEVSPVTRTAIEWRLHKQGGPCYVCLHPDCHSNCHEATLSFLSSVYCWANRDGVCSTCGHRFGSHQVSSSRWRGDAKTEIVNLGDIQRARSEKEKRETAVRALEEQIRGGQEAKARLSAKLFDTLDEYAELGLPDAYKRVLQTQEACLSQELEARPDDTTLEDMLRRVRRYLAELESSPWREPVKGGQATPCGPGGGVPPASGLLAVAGAVAERRRRPRRQRRGCRRAAAAPRPGPRDGRQDPGAAAPDPAPEARQRMQRPRRQLPLAGQDQARQGLAPGAPAALAAVRGHLPGHAAAAPRPRLAVPSRGSSDPPLGHGRRRDERGLPLARHEERAAAHDPGVGPGRARLQPGWAPRRRPLLRLRELQGGAVRPARGRRPAPPPVRPRAPRAVLLRAGQHERRAPAAAGPRERRAPVRLRHRQRGRRQRREAGAQGVCGLRPSAGVPGVRGGDRVLTMPRLSKKEKRHRHNLLALGAEFLNPRWGTPCVASGAAPGALRAPGRGVQRGSTKSARSAKSLCLCVFSHPSSAPSNGHVEAWLALDAAKGAHVVNAPRGAVTELPAGGPCVGAL